MPLKVVDHPVAQHLVALLRDKETEPVLFRSLCHQLTAFLAMEATRDLPLREVAITTPLETCKQKEMAKPVVVIGILRAGIGMIEPITSLLPDVTVGFIGMERNEETAEARAYYCKLPPMDGRRVLLVDPMLATGGSALQSLEKVKAEGGRDIVMLSIVAAPEGVQNLLDHYPDLIIYTAALDRQLNDKKYILPGLGDFGDRLFGTY